MDKSDGTADAVTRRRGRLRTEVGADSAPTSSTKSGAGGVTEELAPLPPMATKRASRRRPVDAVSQAEMFADGTSQAKDQSSSGGGKSEPRRLPLGRHRGVVGRGRGRDSNISGLLERSRQALEQRSILPSPDPFLQVMPSLRQVLLNHTLDETASLLTDALAGALAPAIVQLWLANPTPWSSEHDKVGGQELAPALRARAESRSTLRAAVEPGGSVGANTLPEQPGATSAESRETHRLPARESVWIAEVATSQRSLILFEADLRTLAGDWPELAPIRPRGADFEPEGPPPALGTVAIYPLQTRGQFLGILAVGAATRFGTRHLTALEDLADLAALAADRDRLLSYSRSQEALAQTVVRQAPVAIAVLSDDEHAVALSNPAFATLLGLEQKATLMGQRLSDLLPADRADSVAASLRLEAVYHSGEPQAMIELPIHHRERGMTYWNVTSSPLPGGSARVTGVLVAAVEVTRQVVARQRAQESAEMAQDRIGQMMTLHATSLAVASQLGADPRELLADILRRSIALLNARAGAVYVLDPHFGELEVVVCQGLRGDYTGARIRVGEGLAGRVGQTGQGLIVDDYRAYPFRTAIYDDEDFSAVIAVPLIHRGQVVGVLDVLDDAERRAFTDDDLWLLDLFAAQAAQAIENARTYVELERAYRKQRDLDRMKDDFIATASHELRTPLTGVQGFLDLLLEYPGSHDEPLAREFLQKASESSQELFEIAERLLQTSRLDTGRMEMHIGPVRLATVVEEVLHSYKGLEEAQGSHYDLHAEIPGTLYVDADLGRLKEVLDNLISNAIKYSPHGGRILVAGSPASFEAGLGLGELQIPRETIAPASGAIDERPTQVMPHLVTGSAADESPLVPSAQVVAAALERPYFMVAVSDHGMGIPSGELANLFRRFSRLESARASQIRGTGLGLYLCRQIMRAMDGDVWLLESTVGQGTSFAFVLPVADSLPVSSPAFQMVSGVESAEPTDGRLE